MLGTYGTPKIEIVSGSGSYVVDSDGRKYLDLLAGIAVSALGHAHPAIATAVAQQAQTLVHTSNLYAHPSGLALAEKLLEIGRAHV